MNEMTAVALDDGTTVACCGTCASYARGATRTTDDATHGSPATPDGDRIETRAGSTPAAEDGDATAFAEPASVCDQCGDSVQVEPFEVVTVADRVEEFCPACKNRAHRDGVVREVRMRCAEACDVLDVDPDRAEGVVRDAYLARLKEVYPDSDDGSREAFRRVQRAYERLAE